MSYISANTIVQTSNTINTIGISTNNNMYNGIPSGYSTVGTINYGIPSGYSTVGTISGNYGIPSTTHSQLSLSGINPIISTDKNSINLDSLIENISIINEMLHIIVPNYDKIKANPTLEDAWEQYKSAREIEPKYNSKEYIAAYHQYKMLEVLCEESNDE